MALFLESYGRAKQLYHSEVSACLLIKQDKYEKAYEKAGGTTDYTLDLGAAAPEHDSDVVSAITEDCDPGGAYGGDPYSGGGLELESYDANENSMDDTVQKAKEKLGKDVGGQDVEISFNKGLGAPPAMTTDSMEGSEETLEEKQAEIKKLQEDLKARNNAVLKSQRKRLNRLKDLGLKAAPKTGFENAIIANQIGKQLRRSPTEKILCRN